MEASHGLRICGPITEERAGSAICAVYTAPYTVPGSPGYQRYLAISTPHYTSQECGEPGAQCLRPPPWVLGTGDKSLQGSSAYSVTTTPCCCIMSLSVSRSRAPELLHQVEDGRTQEPQCSRPGVSVCPPAVARSYGPSPVKGCQSHARPWACLLCLYQRADRVAYLVRRAEAAPVQPAGQPGPGQDAI